MQMAFDTGRRKAAAILTVFRVRLSNEKIRTSTAFWKSAQPKQNQLGSQYL
jgi:hypothetical protein